MGGDKSPLMVEYMWGSVPCLSFLTGKGIRAQCLFYLVEVRYENNNTISISTMSTSQIIQWAAVTVFTLLVTVYYALPPLTTRL